MEANYVKQFRCSYWKWEICVHLISFVLLDCCVIVNNNKLVNSTKRLDFVFIVAVIRIIICWFEWTLLLLGIEEKKLPDRAGNNRKKCDKATDDKPCYLDVSNRCCIKHNNSVEKMDIKSTWSAAAAQQQQQQRQEGTFIEVFSCKGRKNVCNKTMMPLLFITTNTSKLKCYISEFVAGISFRNWI